MILFRRNGPWQRAWLLPLVKRLVSAALRADDQRPSNSACVYGNMNAIVFCGARSSPKANVLRSKSGIKLYTTAALWGNRMDLSIWPVEKGEKTREEGNVRRDNAGRGDGQSGAFCEETKMRQTTNDKAGLRRLQFS